VLGYITDVTGVSSSSFADGPGGAEAVIDQQNAAGGSTVIPSSWW
jgi:hypothetical protein